MCLEIRPGAEKKKNPHKHEIRNEKEKEGECVCFIFGSQKIESIWYIPLSGKCDDSFIIYPML